MSDREFSKQNKKLKTAILFLIFKRLDVTKQVFAAIRQAKPSRLYIAADGARLGHNNESEKVKAVKEYVLSKIDWDCEVKTLFREKNLGCKVAISDAIGWFFEHEEMGIILEDDCLPSHSFFWFCQELLDKYQNDMRIWNIGGTNNQDKFIKGDDDYYFTNYSQIWGWASWANRWQKYDVELSQISNASFINNIIESKKEVEHWVNIFWKQKAKILDSWSYQWLFTIWLNKGISITPYTNLVSNIGFGSEAVHCKKHGPYSNRPRHELSSLKHPNKIVINKKADLYLFNSLYKKNSFLFKVFRRLRKILNSLKHPQ